jgi:hypothetical protein
MIMTPKTPLAAGALAFAMALSLNVMAASDAATDATGAAVQQEDAKQKMKPHSHMEEKMGMMTKAEPATSGKPAAAKRNPAMDRSKHLHPRDGK